MTHSDSVTTNIVKTSYTVGVANGDNQIRNAYVERDILYICGDCFLIPWGMTFIQN